MKKKKIFVALNNASHPIIEELCKMKAYEIKTTTILSSLNHWLKEETPSLVIIQEDIKSHGFFLESSLQGIAGKEFYKQRILPKSIPTLFLSNNVNTLIQEAETLLAG